MNLTQNYFELFGLPQLFAVDHELLSGNYRRLQQELHPDKFARQGAGEQRLAVQFAAFVNGAYQALKSPLLRAEYLLELAGYPLKSDALTVKDSEFLLQQMEWRENLADLSEAIKTAEPESVDASRQLADLRKAVGEKRDLLLSQLDKNFKQQQFKAASQQVVQLHFVEKLISSMEGLEELLSEPIP